MHLLKEQEAFNGRLEGDCMSQGIYYCNLKVIGGLAAVGITGLPVSLEEHYIFMRLYPNAVDSKGVSKLSTLSLILTVSVSIGKGPG